MPGKEALLQALWLLFGQRYSSSGAPLGGQFLVNSYTLGDQGGPRVAMDGAGNFVVAWVGAGPGDDDGVFGRRFSSAGEPLGSDFRINTDAADGISGASLGLARNAAGDFLVIWPTFEGEGGTGLFGRVYAAGANPSGVQPATQ